MKKLLLSLAAVTLAVSANAAVTLGNFDQATWSGDANGFTTTINGWTIAIDKADAITDLVTPTDLIKVYKGATLTLTAPAGESISTLDITTPGSKYISVPTFTDNSWSATTSGTLISATGTAANTVTFAASAGQIRISKIVVNNDSDPVDISNTEETAYTVSKAIELINADEGLDTEVYVKGKISEIKEVSTSYGNATYTITDGSASLTVFRGYYLNGEKFTAEDQIAVDAEVIILGKLMAYNGAPQIGQGNKLVKYEGNGGTTVDPVKLTVNNIAEFIVAATASNYPTVTINNPVTVTYQNGLNLFIKDATGSLQVYGDLGKTYKNGDVIPAGITGAAQNYSNGQYELSSPDVATFGEATAGAAVEPEVLAIEEISVDLASSYIKLENITTSAIADRDFTITDETGTIAGYNTFKIELKEVTEGTIVGIVSVHNGVAQVSPISIEGEGGDVPPVVDPTGTEVTYNFTDPTTLTPAISNEDPKEDGSITNPATDHVFTAGPVNVSVNMGTRTSGDAAALFYSTKGAWSYRFYKNAQMVVSIEKGNILSVKFEYEATSGNTSMAKNTFSAGSYANSTWTGETNEIKIDNASDKTIAISKMTVVYKSDSGIADIEADNNAPVEYYNLQGVRVNGDLTPGLYIRRQGNTAAKVLVK